MLHKLSSDSWSHWKFPARFTSSCRGIVLKSGAFVSFHSELSWKKKKKKMSKLTPSMWSVFETRSNLFMHDWSCRINRHRLNFGFSCAHYQGRQSTSISFCTFALAIHRKGCFGFVLVHLHGYLLLEDVKKNVLNKLHPREHKNLKLQQKIVLHITLLHHFT